MHNNRKIIKTKLGSNMCQEVNSRGLNMEKRK